MGFSLETCHEHAHKADRGEILNRTHFSIILRQRYRELIPCSGLDVAITRVNTCLSLIGNPILTNFHHARMNSHTILEITLILVKRVILVDILNIGC